MRHARSNLIRVSAGWQRIDYPGNKHRARFANTKAQGSQVRRWNSKHMTPVVQEVSHGTWRSSDESDFASGRYDEGYAPFSLSRPAGMNVDRDVTHQRNFVFAKPDYWIIVDYLDARNLHEYSFLFHLAPDVLIESLSDSTALMRSGHNGAP